MGKGSKNRTKNFKKYWDSPYWKKRENQKEKVPHNKDIEKEVKK